MIRVDLTTLFREKTEETMKSQTLSYVAVNATNSKGKFTPGPWKADPYGLNVYAIGEQFPRVRPRICKIIYGGQDDAALIAAAPELLAACKEAAEYLASLPKTQNMIGPEYGIWHRITARINMAEGVK
jgi:hypothetical protein